MKPILKIMENNLNIKGNYYIWWNDQFELNNETKIIVAHDGQVLFDFQSEQKDFIWQLDKIFTEINLNVFVIGIESNTDPIKRVQLLSPFKPSKFKIGHIDSSLMGHIEPLGNDYLKFVKKIIDFELSEYKLINNPKLMLGASMGGYISLHAASLNEFQDFNKFLCLSTALWFNSDALLESLSLVKNKKIFLAPGDNENPKNSQMDYLANSITINEKLAANNDVKLYVLKNGIHRECCWKRAVINNLDIFGSNEFKIDWQPWNNYSQQKIIDNKDLLINKYTCIDEEKK